MIAPCGLNTRSCQKSSSECDQWAKCMIGEMEKAKRANSPEVLKKERDALREIVQELVRSEPTYARGFCIFCDKRDGHEADCLIERAKKVMGQ